MFSPRQSPHAGKLRLLSNFCYRISVSQVYFWCVLLFTKTEKTDTWIWLAVITWRSAGISLTGEFTATRGVFWSVGLDPNVKNMCSRCWWLTLASSSPSSGMIKKKKKKESRPRRSHAGSLARENRNIFHKGNQNWRIICVLRIQYCWGWGSTRGSCWRSFCRWLSSWTVACYRWVCRVLDLEEESS